jgi:hypothetical protein
MLAVDLDGQAAHIAHDKPDSQIKQAVIGTYIGEGDSRREREIDVCIAKLAQLGSEVSPVIAPYLAVIAIEKRILLGLGIELNTSGIALLGIRKQDCEKSRPEKSPRLRRFMIRGGIDQPMRFVPQDRREHIIGEKGKHHQWLELCNCRTGEGIDDRSDLAADSSADGGFLEGTVGIGGERAILEDEVLGIAEGLGTGDVATDKTEVFGVPAEIFALDLRVIDGDVLTVPEGVFGIQYRVVNLYVAGVLEDVFALQLDIGDL